MRIVSYTEARNGLKSVLDGVVEDADCTVITRRGAQDARHRRGVLRDGPRVQGLALGGAR